MESWFPLATVSIASAALWIWRCCAEARARANEPSEDGIMGAFGASSGDAVSLDELGEVNVLHEGPPEAWKRIFIDPAPQQPAYRPRLHSWNGVRVAHANDELMHASGHRDVHQHGERPIRLVRSQRG